MQSSIGTQAKMSAKSKERKQEQHLRGSHIQKHYANRMETPLETAVDQEWHDAEHFVHKMPEAERETLTFHAALTNAIFVGHVMADLDSIAGAIGAAHLYGGTPARASELNSETKWALEKWSCPEPKLVEDLLKEDPTRNVCLVDFQQQTQLHESIPMANIVGVIDHHALQGRTIITEKPVFVDIRPWGAVSSILAHSYAVQEVYLPKIIAGMLLSAILSDTLNLRSPTTTKWDERMVTMLVQYLEIVGTVNELAAAQFRAKSRELSLMTPYQLVNGDTKQFNFTNANDPSIHYTIGYGVIETTDAAASLARVEDEVLPELNETRNEKDLTALLLAVVDIVNLTSTLILAGPIERSLAVRAYEGCTLGEDGHTMELKGKVSRKKDFIPPLTRAIQEGWSPPDPERPQIPRKRSSVIVMDYSGYSPGKLKRVYDQDKLEKKEDW